MGRLAELANLKELEGPITVSFLDGTVRTFKYESEALEILDRKKLKVEYVRGGFRALPKDNSGAGASKDTR